uniref:Uncharacterized protein n=1 Tax=Lepeophtheirus salmonis TaxID=72036 RepID=A0A0K2UIC7_LEPSM
MWSGKIKCTKCNWTTDNEENLFMKYIYCIFGFYEHFDSIDQALIFHNLNVSNSHGFFIRFCAKVNLNLSIGM